MTFIQSYLCHTGLDQDMTNTVIKCKYLMQMDLNVPNVDVYWLGIN